MTVAWHPLARHDLEQILAYIAADNPTAAYRVHADLTEQTARLVQYPEIGRLGRVVGTRELVINDTPYVVAYRIMGKQILILRILHGARRWPDRL